MQHAFYVLYVFMQATWFLFQLKKMVWTCRNCYSLFTFPKNVFNFVVLNAKFLVPFNLLMFNFDEELMEEWQFESKSDGSVHEETYGYCYSQAFFFF